MEQKTWLRAVLAVLVVATAASFAHAQTRLYPNPTPAARSYLCFEGRSATEVTKKANEAGARGWKLVTAAPVGPHGAVWCLEQLSAGRPEAAD